MESSEDTNAVRESVERILVDAAFRSDALASDERLPSLVSALEALPAFAALRDKRLNTGLGAVGYSTDVWAVAVVRHAEQKGVDQTLRRLQEFLTEDARPGRIVMVISSIFVSTPIAISPDISLVPLDALKSNTLESYRNIAPMAGGVMKVAAALVIRHTVKPAFLVLGQKRDYVEFSTAVTQLEDARRCLCFFGPSTPVNVAYMWEAADDEFGLAGASWTSPIVELIGYEQSH